MFTPRLTLHASKSAGISEPEPLRLVPALALLTALTGSAGCAGSDGVAPATSSSGAAGSASGGFAGVAGGSSIGGSASLGGSAGMTAGSANGGSANGGSGGGAIEPTFAMLQGVIKMSCFGGVCHDLPEHPLHLTLDDKLYTTLTTHMTKHCGVVVKPGSPQDSALVKLLKGPCNGTDRMPYNKCVEDTDEGCVRPEYIAAIEAWIAKGAPQQ